MNLLSYLLSYRTGVSAQVIPAENLVALAQPPPRSAAGSPPGGPGVRLLAAADSWEEARLMLEALQGGTAGVLLRTDDPAQVSSPAESCHEQGAA